MSYSPITLLNGSSAKAYAIDLRKLVGEARPFSYAAAVVRGRAGAVPRAFPFQATGSSPSTTLFAVSIAVSAWYGGAGPGVLALILSAAAIDYLVLEPGTFLHFTSIGETVLFACYILAWLGFCLLTERTYRSCVATGICGAWPNRPPPIRSRRTAHRRAGTGANARSGHRGGACRSRCTRSKRMPASMVLIAE